MSQNELHVIFGTGALGKWTARELINWANKFVSLAIQENLTRVCLVVLRLFKAMPTTPVTISK